MTIILSDFSQMMISSFAAQAKDLKDGDTKDLIKHIALNQLLALKKKFNGRMILCCDSKSYWRRDEFPYYKGHRKHHREKDNSFLDWKLVFETLDELKTELVENFPYMVLEVQGAEADDIIAVLTYYFDENELVNTGLIEEPDQIIICSTDEDFQQLQKFRNVQQWNNVQKMMMVCKNPKQFLIEHICSGDTGDNIPNIMTGDWWAKARADNEPTRAKAFATARFKDFYNKGYDACTNEEEQRNFRRNEKLIDFDFIPKAIYNEIINSYLRYEIKGSKAKVFKYLQDRRMKLLLASAQDF